MIVLKSLHYSLALPSLVLVMLLSEACIARCIASDLIDDADDGSGRMIDDEDASEDGKR